MENEFPTQKVNSSTPILALGRVEMNELFHDFLIVVGPVHRKPPGPSIGVIKRG